ncbi:MAG: N-acetylmuramoyl-L-alanine amidase [Acidobacteriota bacterium]
MRSSADRRSLGRIRPALVQCAIAVALCAMAATPALAQSARARYEAAVAREAAVRTLIENTGPGAGAPSRARVEKAVGDLIEAYLAIVRRYPTSGYSDNALFQAAGLREAMFARYGRARDRDAALTLYRRVAAEYPTSSLIRRARPLLARLEAAAAPPPTAPAASPPPRPAAAREMAPTAEPGPPPSNTTPAEPASSGPPATLSAIDRVALPEAVRVTLTLDREVAYHEERIADPDRLFFDLRGVQLAADLVDAHRRFPSDVVREIRTGRHPDDTVRVVLDFQGVSRYSVFRLYNPFRLIIDAERLPGAAAAGAGASTPGRTPPSPAAPPANAAGRFSLARQLGLGVSRVVIDPGHGGHDPGAQVRGLNEADVTLDVALRLERLLQQEPGVEVVLTRRTDVYVPLEERTAIANRENADLFLSIHVNASRNRAARGVETYYLSFAASPEAEAVAARENAASERAMRNLPDIIKAIALNTKLDESKDLAALVQESLVTRLRRADKNVRNLGVKKAPFVVLIGAGMPSILAEISFLTNREEAALLRTSAYKQRVAEALHEAVLRYRRTLKTTARSDEQYEP